MQYYYKCQSKPRPCIPNMEGKWTFMITHKVYNFLPNIYLI